MTEPLQNADSTAPLADPAAPLPEPNRAATAAATPPPLDTQIAGGQIPRPALVEPAVASAETAAPLLTDEDDEPLLSDNWLLQVPSWLSSMVVHLSLVLLLALLTVANSGERGLDDLTVFSEQRGSDTGVEELESPLLETSAQLDDNAAAETLDLTQPADLAGLSAPIGLIAPRSVHRPGRSFGGRCDRRWSARRRRRARLAARSPNPRSHGA